MSASTRPLPGAAPQSSPTGAAPPEPQPPGPQPPASQPPGAEPPAGEAPPAVRMMQLLYGGMLANLVSAVAELGVADLLADGPRPVEELAERTGAHPDALHRVLRALSAAAVFTEVAPREYGLTPLAGTLRGGVPGSMREHARNWGTPGYQQTIIGLRHSVRTGEPTFDHVFGTDWWSYLAGHPEQAGSFNRAMSDRARQVVAAAAEACDLTGARRVVDVGGGHGQLIAALLERHPGLTGTVFDRPEVAAGAVEVLAGRGLGERADAVGGDFFDTVPPGADAYLLSSVLHDWDDPRALDILRTVRRALPPTGRVMVLEVVLAERDPSATGALLDVLMLALVGGRERTASEWGALFGGAGLRLVDVVPTASPVSLVIGEPA